MEKIKHTLLFFILLQISIAQSSLSFFNFSSTNYRNSAHPQISSKPSNAWILGFSTYDSNLVNRSSLYLPMVAHNETLIVSKFSISQQANYMITVKINLNGVNKNVSLSTGSSYNSEQNPGPTNTFTFPFYYTMGDKKFGLWLDGGIVLEDMSIKMQSKYFKIQADNTHYVTEKKLIIKTNITRSDVSDLAKFVQKTNVTLKYKQSVSQYCSQSKDAPQNPMNFVGFTTSKNYTQIASQYSIQLLSNGDLYYPSTGYNDNVVLMVSNIWVDCSVDVIINFPQITHKKYLSSFTVLTPADPIAQYSTKKLSCGTRLIYKIADQLVSLTLKGLPINWRWSMTELKKTLKIKIDGNVCELNKLVYWDQGVQTQFYCKNSSQIFWTSRVSEFIIPNNYLIHNATKQILELTISDWLLTMTQIEQTRGNVSVFSILYFEVNQSLQISLDMLIQQQWRPQEIVKFMQKIEIDNVPVSISLFDYVQTVDKKYKISGIVPSVVSSSVIKCTTKANTWWFKNNLGYDIMWKSQLTNTKALQYIVDLDNGNSNGHPGDDDNSAGDNGNVDDGSDVLVVSDFIYSSIVVIQNYANGVGMLLFNYLINSLVAFKDLSFLFYFVEFKYILNSRRSEISNGINLLQGQDGVIGFFNYVSGTNIKVEPPSVSSDKLQEMPVGKNYNRLWDFGFFSTFLNNNFDGLLIVSIAILKILLLFFLSKIPIRFVRRLLNPVVLIWKELLLTQLVMMSPPLYLVFISHFQSSYPFQLSTFYQKSNLAIIILASFICGISCFLLYAIGSEKIEKVKTTNQQKTISDEIKMSRARLKASLMTFKGKIRVENVQQTTGKTKQKIESYRKDLKKQRQNHESNPVLPKEKQRTPFSKQFVLLIDNSMYFLVPFCVGIGSSTVLVFVGTLISLGRLILVLKRREQFSRGQLFRQVLSKMLWFAFTSVYLIYWFLEVLSLDCLTGSTCYDVLIILDLAQTFLFIGGCFLQILLGIVTFMVELFLEMKKITCKKYKKWRNKQKIASQKGEDAVKTNSESIQTVNKIQNLPRIKFNNPFAQQKLNTTAKSRKMFLRTKKETKSFRKTNF